jgi:acetyl-CoA C-acetyltransferase
VVASGHETWTVAERRHLDRSPALAAAAAGAFRHVGSGIDDIDHIDLYACFPSMVQMSSAALGIGDGRPLTITGGLGFAGAPIGNSVGHSIAAMVERVRAGGRGLVHGNGGNATKQSFAIYAAEPSVGFARVDIQHDVDLEPRAVLPDDWGGRVTVDAATLVFGRHGPDHVLAGVIDAGGARGWATSRDESLLAALTSDGLAGSAATRTPDGELRV